MTRTEQIKKLLINASGGMLKPEEVEKLLNEVAREASENAWGACHKWNGNICDGDVSKIPNKKTYLDTHHPLK